MAGGVTIPTEVNNVAVVTTFAISTTRELVLGKHCLKHQNPQLHSNSLYYRTSTQYRLLTCHDHETTTHVQFTMDQTNP